MKDCEEECILKICETGTMNTCTMQLGTPHVQIRKNQICQVRIIAKKCCLCYRYSMPVYSMFGNRKYRATYCMYVELLVKGYILYVCGKVSIGLHNICVW